MRAQSERGVALILALFLTTALSVLAASLMFLSQTETYASMNYRMMSQARYAAEAGVQKASNHLLASYVPPSDTGTDLLTLYNFNVSPVVVLANNQPVVLSAKDATCTGSNYPVAAVQTAFCNAAKGSLTAGSATITYNATATLMAMQTFTSYGGGLAVVQTWQILGDGGLTGARNSTVEVMATVETPKVAANSFAAFGTDPGCAALNFGGNSNTDSYSTNGLTGNTTPSFQNEGGDVGTNGNLTIGGHVGVQGNLSTPRTGVGACDAGNVTALTQSGQASVGGSTVQLPKSIIYPAPTIPTPSALPEVSLAGAGTTATTCLALGLTVGTSANDVKTGAATAKCFVDSGTDTIYINGHGTTLSLPSVSPTSHVKFALVAGNPGTYNFNSINLGGQSEIEVSALNSTQSVVVNIVGKDNMGADIAAPLTFTGGTAAGVTDCASCSNYDASMLQFLYGGSGNIDMGGNSSAAAIIYAPNAAITLHGTPDVYGSLLGKTIDVQGNVNIHYDTSLQGKFFVRGSPVIGTFTWKRY